jgi:hypothetical protein
VEHVVGEFANVSHDPMVAHVVIWVPAAQPATSVKLLPVPFPFELDPAHVANAVVPASNICVPSLAQMKDQVCDARDDCGGKRHNDHLAVAL